jgi:hypothetical protein
LSEGVAFPTQFWTVSRKAAAFRESKKTPFPGCGAESAEPISQTGHASTKKAAAFPPRPYRTHEAFKPDEASVVVITTI